MRQRIDFDITYTGAVESPLAPAGSEFQLNPADGWNQGGDVSVAGNDDGFVAVWVSQDQDGSVAGVYGRLFFDAGGTPLGAEFLVPTTTSLSQVEPSVAMAEDGSFVVLWAHSIERPRFNGNGDPIINPHTGLQLITADTDIYGRQFSASGTPLGGEFQVNASNGHYALLDQRVPQVTYLADGTFAVTWDSESTEAGAGGYPNYDIITRIFNAGGSAATRDIVVHTNAAERRQPSITALANGSFVVAWDQRTTDDGPPVVTSTSSSILGLATRSPSRTP